MRPDYFRRLIRLLFLGIYEVEILLTFTPHVFPKHGIRNPEKIDIDCDRRGGDFCSSSAVEYFVRIRKWSPDLPSDTSAHMYADNLMRVNVALFEIQI